MGKFKLKLLFRQFGEYDKINIGVTTYPLVIMDETRAQAYLKLIDYHLTLI